MHGNAISYGHAGIGRAALRRGDVAESKQRPLAALEPSGLSQLGSFGPNPSLAEEFLDLGERESCWSCSSAVVSCGSSTAISSTSGGSAVPMIAIPAHLPSG